ncbi:RHS repeat-associated protein [Myroides gitamensis]|uniref:RHS repeat-associated core domain-containing protein n=1 Tax=Myroides odoratus TaxID=256 RepID=UPI0021676FE3|nr:RHS repeat-associated core domain-containing protein [Myroides odoratus]MCS4239705.1 RHS repeat-associated protein [Myroides odoratus]MDH6601219.1 RHS repeat-associated protein [Myroides gitamensis]
MKQITRYILFVFGLTCSSIVAQTRTENYIKTTQPQYATNSSFTSLYNPPKLETVVYYDGLGRPKQEIAVGIGPKNKNVIRHIEYELNIGQTKEYLPFVYNYNPDTGQDQSPLSDANKMPYLSYAKNQTEAFYNSAKYERTTNPYSETEFEKSPLKRILQQASPGEDWKMATNASHTVKHTYRFNMGNHIKKFKAIATWDASLKAYDIRLVDEGYFAANKLYSISTKDEDGNYSERFTDQEDKVLATVQVLDRELAVVDPTWPGGSLSGGITGGISNELAGKSVSEIIDHAEDIGNNLTDQVSEGVNSLTPPVIPKDPGTLSPYFGIPLYTYYVYDQYNNLTYVLPPLAYGKTDATTLDKLCYQYKYDHKNRLVAKKLPGKEWEFMVYDKADRLLAQGPVYSPFGDEAKGWMFSKYDAFGRVVYTGFYTGTPSTAVGRTTFQNLVNSSIDIYEKRTVPRRIDRVLVPYTNNTMPKTELKILKLNYYDDYEFMGNTEIAEQVEGQSVILQVKGLITGTWAKILHPSSLVLSDHIVEYKLYDDKERILRNQRDYVTVSRGLTRVDTKYNFRGLPIKTVTRHQFSGGSQPIEIMETFTYDKAERLLYQTHKVDNANPVVLFENIYDELGRVKQKRIGGRETAILVTDPVIRPAALDFPIIKDINSTVRSSFLQELNYTYNIRGWLTQVNSTNNLEAGDFGKKALFAMKLNYNTLDSEGISGVKKLYNGNIAEQTWKTVQDNVLRRYSYAYDKVNRLKAGTYQEPGGIIPIIGLYDETMGYDANGNITSLNRKGRSVNTAIALDLDQLTYSYDGNILQKVVDSSNNTDGFKQGSTADKHYDYDSFGNLKADRNKGITGIKYNHLNLPVEILFDRGKITYLYTATGEKINKVVTQGGGGFTVNYFDGFQYFKGKLLFFPTAEGYFNAETSSYVYQYRDHLGNVRLSYSDANKNDKIDVGEIIEETNYYPFGLAHQGYNEKNNTIGEKYKYQYNGKELQDELGLNLYDYGARNYDAALGRWMNVDPLAEKMPQWNPYAYTFNNPINMVDPTGMIGEDWIEHTTDKGEKLLTYDALVHSEEDAIDRGYRNVKGVSETMSYNGTSGTESYSLNADGSVTDNLSGTTTDVGFSPMRTSDGFYISENNHLKAISSGLQEGGTKFTEVGLGLSITGVGAPLGGPLMSIGGFMSLIGTTIESGFMLNRGEEKKAAVNFGVSLIFSRSGKYGIKATERAIGRGLSRGGTTLINGINYTMEETIGADTKEWLMK